MYFYDYYLLPQKERIWFIFADKSKALNGATVPIAHSVGRSVAP